MYYILYNVSIYSDLLPIAIFLIFFKKIKKKKDLLALVLYVTVSFVIVNILDNVTFKIPPASERLLFSFLTITEYSCFSFFFYRNIISKYLKKLIIIITISFILFCIIYAIYAPNLPIDSIPIGIETIIILGVSFGFFYEMMNDSKTIFIHTDYRFWIVLAFMIYLAGSFFIYIFANQIPKAELPKYWMFTYVFYAIKNILFSLSMLIFIFQKPPKKHRLSQSSPNPILDIM